MSRAATDRARCGRAGTAATLLWVLLGGIAVAQQNTDLILPPSADVAVDNGQGERSAGGAERGPAASDDETAAAANASDGSPARSPAPGDTADGDAADGAAPGGAASVGAVWVRERASAASIAVPDQTAPLPMEEVIVVDESEWRLPDLGSEWRQAHAEEPDTGRIQLSFMPLYDPENADPVPDIFERNSALHRMQMIEVIRVRFGGRPQD